MNLDEHAASGVAACVNADYGCCEDGITPAEGLDRAGCLLQEDSIPHAFCVDSEYGCCADQVTPALGPFGEGCAISQCHVSIIIYGGMLNC